MPTVHPITASGSRNLEKKPRPLPKNVKEMVGYMVRGAPGDEDCLPLSFIAAGRLAGITPDVARRWLDRPETRAFLRAERASFRTEIAAGNELTLQRLRDSSPNQMVQLRSVQVLNEMDREEMIRPAGQVMQPGMIIVIAGVPPTPSRPSIDVTPVTVDDAVDPPADL